MVTVPIGSFVPHSPRNLVLGAYQSGRIPGCIRTGSKNSEAADSVVFIRGIYKNQQPVNGGRHDRSCFCCVSWGL